MFIEIRGYRFEVQKTIKAYYVEYRAVELSSHVLSAGPKLQKLAIDKAKELGL